MRVGSFSLRVLGVAPAVALAALCVSPGISYAQKTGAAHHTHVTPAHTARRSSVVTHRKTAHHAKHVTHHVSRASRLRHTTQVAQAAHSKKH